MIFITQSSEISMKRKGVVLYFYASWMPFHKKMVTILDKMEEKFKKLTFLAIDVDYFKDLTYQYEVISIPEIVILDQGEAVKRANGVMLTSAVRSFLASYEK